MLGEKSGEVGGEPLVEPDVRPVLAGQEVAEPLVGQLVRDQAVGVCLEAGDLVDAAPLSVIVVAVMFSIPPATKSGTQTWAYLS